MPPSPKQTLCGTKPSPTGEFFSGAGEGRYRVGKNTVAGGYSLLTTNPITTVSNAAIGAVEAINSVLGKAIHPRSSILPARCCGSASVPVRSLTRYRFDLGQNRVGGGWAKETLTSGKPWKVYNDTATGARSGRAPTPMRTPQDGSARPVKLTVCRAKPWSTVNGPSVQGHERRRKHCDRPKLYHNIV